jgi:hypothetical protein
MNPTYTVRGADGREYGPVSLEQITAWTREGRILAQNEIRRNDMEHWAHAGDFTELKDMFPQASPAPSAVATAPQPMMSQAGTVTVQDQAVQAAGRGATWFYWIAGLSAVNAVMALTGKNIRFIFGLGITDIFTLFGHEFGGSGQVVGFVLALGAAGLFVLLGRFAMKGHLWAFITGIVLFGLDALALLPYGRWLGIAFHAYVLFRLFSGMMAMREIKARATLQA